MPTLPKPALRRRYTLVLAIGLAVVSLDVATKTWAVKELETRPVSLPGMTLTLSRNAGAAFGTATSATPLLTVLAAGAVVAVLVVTRRIRSAAALVAAGLVAGGATGNLIDRLFRAPGLGHGHVVDWISVGWWPTFNLADSALVTAACLVAMLSLRSGGPNNAHHEGALP